jgi:hypothetical protein
LIFYYTKPNIQQARLQYKEKYEKEWERYNYLRKGSYKNIVLDIMINHCEYNIEKYTNCSDNDGACLTGYEITGELSWLQMNKKMRLKNIYDILCNCVVLYCEYCEDDYYLNSGCASDYKKEEEEEGSYSIWKAYDKGNHNTEENYEMGFTSYQEALDRAEELKDDCLSSGQMMQHLSIIDDADDDHIWNWSREDEEDESEEEDEIEEEESEYESDSDVNRELALMSCSDSDEEDVVVIDASHLWNSAKIVYQADPK